MNLFLDYTDKQIDKATLNISGSKSESNRLLILQKLFPNLSLENTSDSDDSKHLIQALNAKEELIDVGHAGTAMRFLTAYFAATAGSEVILTGSERMQNRPVKVLVDALRELGAEIQYVDKKGYPPLKITGKKLTKSAVSINGNVSSQYVSALLLIAATLQEGLEITLVGEVTSQPYLEMTLALLNEIGIDTHFKDSKIKIYPKETIDDVCVTIESDWSSASYYYSLIALSEIGATITLSSYKEQSLQGDSCLIEIYKTLGVATTFQNNTMTLEKIASHSTQNLVLNLRSAPDIAQTIAVTCFGLGIACNLTGLHTLKIKETDRLVALLNELHKLGAEVEITNKSIHLKASSATFKNKSIPTYNDHRMAMAFAPLALLVPITIEDADVVTKSYTNFWEDLASCFD
tara:strand:- start:481469 stop:482683 length:1215 start_codon:yes stop_codon:yes gene_type:complete